MIIMDSYLGEEKKVTKISYSNILAQVEKNKKYLVEWQKR